MTRWVFVLVPLGVLFGVWVGEGGSGPPIYVGGAVAGLVVAGVLWAMGRRRTRALSLAVNSWMGKLEVEPIDLRGGPDHRELGTALNTLGAAYARRGRRVQDEAPEPEQLVEALPEPAVLLTLDGVVTALNPTARDLLGAGDTPGLSATQALGSSALVDLVEDVIRDPGAGAGVREVTVGQRIVAARATRFAGQVLLSLRDLTEVRRIAAVRRDFVTNASHELKTPVAGIQSLADAMDVVLDSDPERAAMLLGRLRGEADRMGELVGDLLSLRRVEDGRSAAPSAVDVERLAAEVLAAVAPRADDREVEVELDVPSGLTAWMDPDDLRLILSNLVENAVTYNRAGGTVTVTGARDGAEVVLTIQDTGIGIPSQDLDRVFERFYRVDPGRSREAGGTGLGLSIVRHAVELHGGRIEVASLLGQGSTFTVWLPASEPPTTGS